MKMQEIRAMAKAMGVTGIARMGKADLIRAIQRAEENFDCFGTAEDEYCDQESCIWREDCLIESVEAAEQGEADDRA